MRTSRELKPAGSGDELWLAAAGFPGSATACQSGGRRPKHLGETGKGEDAELLYDLLVSHALECPTCWSWRNQLWAVHRLCPTGAGLADRYAVAEARTGERQ